MSITKLQQWEREQQRRLQRQRKLQARLQPTILFEDAAIIVVAKPAGVSSIPDRWNPLLPNVRDYLTKHFGQKVWTIHRLDKGTSGVMVFARTAEAHKELNMQFEHRTVKKIYHALVDGQFPYETLEIDIPLRRTHRGDRVYPSILGQTALTRVRQLHRFRRATLLECELQTGRHHQIRVHLATLGFPLLVDELYGVRSAFFLSEVKPLLKARRRDQEETPLINRLTLHSYQLQFAHPVNGKQLVFTAPYPRDFAATLRMLEKYDRLPQDADL